MDFFKKLAISICILFPILYFLPWWSGVIICVIIGFSSNTYKDSILKAGIGLSSCWVIMLVFRWLSGGHILMERIAEMFSVNNPFLLGLIIILLPLILGGISGLTGKFIKEALD